LFVTYVLGKTSLKAYFKDMFEVQERLLMMQEEYHGGRRNSPELGNPSSPRRKTPVTVQNARILALPEIEKQVYILLDQLENDKDNFSSYIKIYDE
jgi:hypothetical protein